VDWSEDCAALIPCFNEAPRIAEVVRTVREHLVSVLVMDDGSTDATAAAAKAAGAEVVQHAVNRGKGAALRVGFQHLRDSGFSWALTLDGDGQHAADDIPRFLACAETTGAPLIIGNRMTQTQAMPWVRRRVNRWMSRRISRRGGGVALPDTQCGFRLINLEALGGLALQTEHFEIESELLLAFLRAGKNVESVPVQTIYQPGGSKINPVIDTWRWLRWWYGKKS
jgi:glycosyltransferase involved in cell wall biosynthesis